MQKQKKYSVRYPLSVVANKPISWVLSPANWMSLPEDERSELATSGFAPLTELEYQGHQIAVGVWQRDLVFDLSKVLRALNVSDQSIHESVACTDHDNIVVQLVIRSFDPRNNGWLEFKTWVTSKVVPHFGDVLDSHGKRKWKVYGQKRNSNPRHR